MVVAMAIVIPVKLVTSGVLLTTSKSVTLLALPMSGRTSSTVSMVVSTPSVMFVSLAHSVALETTSKLVS